MPLLILPAAAMALALGFGVGWFLRGRGRTQGSEADWKTRLAARDRDLYEARQELADLAVTLQELQSPTSQTSGTGDADRTRAEELAERLRSAEAELADARNLEPGDAGTGSPDLLHRIEELEAELTTLASHRCPDPSAHAHPGLMTSSRTRRANGTATTVAAVTEVASAVVDDSPSEVASPIQTPADDLTRVAGIGVGLAKVLRSMGIASFEQLAAMDDETIGRLDDLVGGIRERSQRHDWAGVARSLGSEGSAAAS